MYGLVDLYIAEEIAHNIGRSQAAREAQALLQPKRLSLVARLLNKLPLRTINRQIALDVQCEEPALNTAQCE